MTRCFVIGNGPSLQRTNLELLSDEYSWGVNQVHMIYPQTSWRPTHITFAEMTAGGDYWYPRIWEAIHQNPLSEKYARDDAWWWNSEMEEWFLEKYKNKRLVDGALSSITRYNACTHHDILDEEPGELRYTKVPECWHFPQVCKFGGSIPMTIQLAVQEGFDEIYLIGCDLGHKEGTSNHFHEDYAVSRGITAEKAVKRNEANRMGHEYCLRNSPVPIYNATVGGELEVYPRVEYDSLFYRR